MLIIRLALFGIITVLSIKQDISDNTLPAPTLIAGIIAFLILRAIPEHSLYAATEFAIVVTVGTAIWLAMRGGLGWGDTVMTAMATAAFGWRLATLATVVAIVTAAIFASILLLAGRVKRTYRLPYAPFFLPVVWLCLLVSGLAC